MSDASPANKLGPPRQLREQERAIVEKLVSGTPSEKRILGQLQECLVRDMADGGMGSIQFCKHSSQERTFGQQIAEGSFHDADGVLVSVTLNVDQDGDLFELDLWKVDFSPLIRYPDLEDLAIIQRDERGNVIAAE